MSSSTALLPKDPKKRGDEHPIFLRVCHSPWLSIGQKALVFHRGAIATYMLLSFFACLVYDLRFNKHGWLVVFELSNIAYLMQIIYQWLAFVWTTMHLYYPHHGGQSHASSTRLQKAFSPPRQNPATNNRTFFSMFYTAAVTYPHVVTFIHWTILYPNNETTVPAKDMFSTGSYTMFFYLNKFVINSAIALAEVFILSSIRRQDPIPAHIVALILFSLCYVGWAFLGYAVTDEFAYYFFDHKKVGWEHFGLSIIGFLFLTIIWFLFVHGLTGIREKLTKRSEDKKSGGGYTRLPQ